MGAALVTAEEAMVDGVTETEEPQAVLAETAAVVEAVVVRSSHNVDRLSVNN